MKRNVYGVMGVGILIVGALLSAAIAQGKKDIVHVDSAKATYKELAPGA